MAEIEKHALALVNAVNAERSRPEWRYLERPKDAAAEALCRALEQHEAFRQEVSDAVEAHLGATANIERSIAQTNLRRFIIPKPVDPLVEALRDMQDGRAGHTTESYAACIRQALADRGFEIVEVGHE